MKIIIKMRTMDKRKDNGYDNEIQTNDAIGVHMV